MPTVTVTFDFPGGTLSEYVQTIRDAAGDDPVNVLISDSAAGIPIPATSMRRVSPEAAFDILSVVAELPPTARLIVESSDGGRGTAPAYAINLVNHANVQFRGERQIQVFSLGWLLNDPDGRNDLPMLSTDEVLGAVESTIEMIAKEDQPTADVRFHPDSNLLVVYGTPLQINAVSDIIERLDEDLGERRQQMREATDQMREMEQQLEELRISMKQAAREIERREIHARRAEEAAAAGGISETDLVDELTKLEASRDEMQRLESQMQYLEENLHLIGGKPDDAEHTVSIRYEVDDLGPFADGFLGCAGLFLDLAEKDFEARDIPNGGIAIEASPRVHAALQYMFVVMLRIKANDPELPLPEFESID
jgi:hypothetical protein